jgi:hypothetical protein
MSCSGGLTPQQCVGVLDKGSSIQDLWELEQRLILSSWRNGNKTQPVMDIWLKYM